MGTAVKDFFTSEEQEVIKQAIRNAELDTSGEIRVHLENSCSGEVLDRAAFIFKHLGMNKTELRNGVLIYLAVKDHLFAIIGDKGMHKVVPEYFWDEIKAGMLANFRENRFARGLTEAIITTGVQLKKHFPRQDNDINELPDDISFGEGK
ncbi:MAG: TPM domain-containing protein [Bacteroidales bacterium]|nr:TPM domain-containing protein [Bacteroidales bacterium]